MNRKSTLAGIAIHELKAVPTSAKPGHLGAGDINKEGHKNVMWLSYRCFLQ